MLKRIKTFAEKNKQTIANSVVVGAVAGLIGMQLIQNQNRANARADGVRKDMLETIDNHFAEK